MTDLRQAEQQALENLEKLEDLMEKSIIALRTALAQQAEPVRWDKTSASFDEWWDGDYEDPANPFEKDSAAWWAWAGWKAAQRPWVGLTDEVIMVIGDKVANEDLVGLVSNFRGRLARAIEQTLKERNR